MPLAPQVAAQAAELPDRPGIYIYRDAAGGALYVGKAKSLRKRVMSYGRAEHEPRIRSMVAEAAVVEFVVTDTEAEALLLENSWIKRLKPRYNVLLRDDKSYPYLKLTVQEETPKIAFTRRLQDDGAEYYGPYLPAGLARKAIKLVQKLFQVRVCHIEIDGKLPRPCLSYDMRRCLGPCVAGLTTAEEYARAVDDARLLLSGRTEPLLRRLGGEMRSAADALEFEEAARLRDTIAEIESLSERRKLSSTRGDDVDIFGVAVHGSRAAVAVLIMRGGQTLDRREYFWEGTEGLSAERLLSELLPQIYDRTTFIPKEVHLPVPIDGDEALGAWLSERKGERVYLRLPARGPKSERVRLANRNAELGFRRRFRAEKPGLAAARRLAEHLDLGDPPRRIEGFDISNLHGRSSVASLVVWEGGKMRKSDYRSFNIRGDEQPDDYAAIRQAVERRYRRRLDELGDMPDLILIDGGRGQLNVALQALAVLGVEETPIVGLAKREELIVTPASPEPIRLERTDPGLKLLQEVRDEAHRFALRRHRARRSKTTLASRLDEVRGIGPRRRRRLLRRFGSLKAISEAGVDELQEELGKTLGRRLHEALQASRPGAEGGSNRMGQGKG